jgi:hypothetical protein
MSGHEPDQRQDQSALGVKENSEPAKDPVEGGEDRQETPSS